MDSSICPTTPLPEEHPFQDQEPPLYPQPNDVTVSSQDSLQDQICFLRTVEAFRCYSHHAAAVLSLRRDHFQQLTMEHASLLGIDVDAVIFQPYANGIFENQKFLDVLCDNAYTLFESYWPNVDRAQVSRGANVKPNALDVDKVHSTLRQAVRDWSVEGQPEREVVHQPLRNTLCTLFPDRSTRCAVRVLVPGAGLSRLAVDLAALGFSASGNEFSYHMLIAGHVIMNHMRSAREYKIYPYIESTVNLVSRKDQSLGVDIPDVCTFQMQEALESHNLQLGDLSMIAGDFVEVFSKPCEAGQWHAVASCFFIDTAHNIIEYLCIFYQLLVPGGLFINVGPLLYHFSEGVASPKEKEKEVASSDNHSKQLSDVEESNISIELSLEEVLCVAANIGFLLTAPPTLLDSTYTNNPRSMKQMIFKSAFFVLQKPFQVT